MAPKEEKTDQKETNNTISAPTISLPKGGGAIRGIGEKFAANPVTGTGSMTVPIAVTPGRSGFGPQLSLSYDSGSGNGPFGFGWSLSLPSITRKTDKGLPKYQDADESDEFILSGAEDLVPLLVKKDGIWEPEHVPDQTLDGHTYSLRRYRPRIEGLFARIERWTNKTDSTDVFWRSISKDNITTWYGKTKNSRFFDPDDASHIFSWLICQSYDDKGNAIVYEYAEEDSKRILENEHGQPITLAHEHNRDDQSRSANRYLKYIKYGNQKPNRDNNWQATDPSLLTDWLFEVVFDYGEGHYSEQSAPDLSHYDYAIAQITPPAGSFWPVRQDPFSIYKAGFEVRTYRLCRRVLMFHHFKNELGVDDYLVRSTDFAYSESPIASFITSITQSGYVLSDGGKYIKKSLPPLEFKYSQAIINNTVEEIDAESLQNIPYGVDGSRYQLVDLDGEGISGILTEQANAWFYKPSLGNGSFGPIEVVNQKPSLASLGSGRQQLLDLAGDGQLDLVDFHQPIPGFYERTTDRQWENFRAFESLPNIVWDDPNLKFVDLNGDGHADILITENEVLTWYPSLAERGFDVQNRVTTPVDEEEGPRLVFADGTQSIYLADMSGDGLTDLTRIRNGEICYWPNLGYGKFGKKVIMDNSPWFDSLDQFDQKRIRIADIDGSGNTDIIYLRSNGVSLYFNQSGNGWSGEKKLEQFPTIDNLSSIITADILGDGTACIVWSSPLPNYANRQMKFIRLMKEGKPHLLISVKNNLGAETIVHYAPSTKFYLEDKKNGTPWITRLPFPVHVVECVETIDYISGNQFVTIYKYHHGYFDGSEREFRGFGMVEQWDTEEFETLKHSEAFPSVTNLNLSPTNLDLFSHVPPALTRTWFHTGAFIQGEEISRSLANQYYGAPDKEDTDYENKFAIFLTTLLPDTPLPDAPLTSDEMREACRALKGSMLRQEVYGIDGTDQEKHPYTVTEQNFTIRCLQPQAGNKHVVFFAHPREAISYHYERDENDPKDPRIAHTITLDVDDYGNVRKSTAIGYGRQSLEEGLTVTDQMKQARTLITYTDNTFTVNVNDDDDYRTPLLCEAMTYELTGPGLSDHIERFSFEDWLSEDFDLFPTTNRINYEQPANSGIKENRLIEHVRTLYVDNDLNTLLPLTKIKPMALPGESYRLAFTPELVKNIFIDSGKMLVGDVDRDFGNDGGYVHSEGDNNWWIPSGRIHYWPNETDDSTLELEFAKSHFFLPHRYDDAFNNKTIIAYDSNEIDPAKNYNLLLKETMDPVGNTISAENNYRVLQPQKITDPNGSVTEVRFDALGLVAATAVYKGGEGDSLNNYDLDLINLTLRKIQDFVISPRGEAAGLLDEATTRIVYDLDRFKRCGQPPFASTLARETHFSDPNHQTPNDKIQISFTYSDGFGREIQSKIQAEAGDAPERAIDVPIPSGDIKPGDLVLVAGKPKLSPAQYRWVGKGCTIYNNKGKPVKQYEPFFSWTHLYEVEKELTDTGVSPILFYDPLDRVIVTLHPNHTYEKVVFDPWHQATWDVNDTVNLDPSADDDVKGFFINPDGTERFPKSEYMPTWYDQRINGSMGTQEQDAAKKTFAHAATPTLAYFDMLGRTFMTVANNGVYGKYPTRIELDIENNQRIVKDECKKDDGTLVQRIVMQYDYDMLSNRIHQISMDAGERWMLNDVMQKPIYAWDSRGFKRTITYDELRRPTSLTVEDRSGSIKLVEKTIYGEAQSHSEANNLCTRIYQVYDEAGIVTNEEYDFKGNLRRTSRQLLQDYKTIPDWLSGPRLENEIFISSTRYDALNRPIQIVAPHIENTPTISVDIIQPVYNEANLLDKVHVWLKHRTEPIAHLDAQVTPPTFDAVTNINYNAKGQRELIEYGNGACTTYEYDQLTYRLTHLCIIRGKIDASDCSPQLSPRTCEDPPTICRQLANNRCVLQDLRYTYDPVGNIIFIADEAQQIIYFDNAVVKPEGNYLYDAIYRLIAASGREHKGDLNIKWTSWDDEFRTNLNHPCDGQALRNYTDEYIYDEVGNFDAVIHHEGKMPYPDTGIGFGSVLWRRDYTYEDNKKDNRLIYTTANGIQEDYSYNDASGHDVHGCITSMSHLQSMIWDFKDQLQEVDLSGGGKAYYMYDASGQRVRKVWEKSAGPVTERIYLGGFEIYREKDSAGIIQLERETLHIMDDKQRIALIETRTHGNDNSPQQLIRCQFSNHLGTACLELDDQARIISYEEYYPYGSTSYQAVRKDIEVPLKRYRYTGKERDEESGLYYFGARFYAGWLGRWCSCDPSGVRDGSNLYRFAHNNPIVLKDPTGKQTVVLESSALIGIAVCVAFLVYWAMPSTQQSIRRIARDIPRIGKDISEKLSNPEPQLKPAEPKPLTEPLPKAVPPETTTAPSPNAEPQLKPLESEPKTMHVPKQTIGPKLNPTTTLGPDIILTPDSSPRTVDKSNPCFDCEKWRRFNKEFMAEKLAQILGDKNHPLRFLVDAEKKNWKDRGTKCELGVQAGHRDNKLACEAGFGELSLALEEGWNNCSFDSSFDKTSPISGKPTVMIKGVEVDLKTAIEWQQRGYFKGTEFQDVDFNKMTKLPNGWQPDVCK